MTNRARQFVANDLWLLICLMTIPVAGLTGMVSEMAEDAVWTVGWFMLTPLFLFWGDDFAAMYFDNRSASEPATDPVAELKRRYAEGELSDEEFERRMERLVAAEDAIGDAHAPGDVDRTYSHKNTDETTEPIREH